ncbi:MAG: serine/threonine protein kinase, partial [Holophagales bacterium]|nr:serine/threonine protein kinase [Holophagales bacterium]
RIASLVSGAFALVFTLLHFLLVERWTPVHTAELWAVWGVVLASLAFQAAAREGSVSDATAVGLGRLYGVVACALMGLQHATHELHAYGQVTPFGPYLVLIGCVPLLFRGPLRATLTLAGATCLSSLAGLLLGAWIDNEPIDLLLLADLSVGLLSGIAIAALVHRSLLTLRRETAAEVRFGSYRLRHKLGEGGMGEVWWAEHPLLARPAAVKVVRAAHLEGSPEQREVALARFHREARTIAALQSSHTVKLYDFGVSEDGTLFLAMEMLEGWNLRALVKRFGPQPVDRVREILLQMCDSLDEAHGLGLVHRDIKPANVMLCRGGRRADLVKVLDFGSVGPREAPPPGDAQLTATGTFLGTPAYLAPEVLGGGQVADARSDLYGVGCVAYWLLAGRPVFEYDSPVMQIAAHLRDVPEPPSARGPALPSGLEEVVLSCLAKDPADRPASAAELARRLEALPSAGDWPAQRADAWWLEHPPGAGQEGRPGSGVSVAGPGPIPGRPEKSGG